VAFHLRVRALASVNDALTLRLTGRPAVGWPDARDAVRLARHQPAFLLAVVVTLGLGMGAATAMFSVVDALIVHPLPFREPDRLVNVEGSRLMVEPPLLELLRSETRIFESVQAMSTRSALLTGAGEPRQLRLEAVEPGFLDMLGIVPLLGRGFLESETDPGRDRVVLIADDVWRGAFAADPGIVGRIILLDGDLYTVVGVLPRTLRRTPGGLVHGIVPLTQPVEGGVHVLARLERRITLEMAETRLGEIGAILDRGSPRERAWDPGISFVGTGGFRHEREALIALAGAAALLLLVSCANAAGLLFVRGVERDSEFTVRRALGASRASLFRQLLTESTAMSVLAGGLGTLTAVWGVRGLLAIAPETLTRWHYNTVNVNGRALVFALFVTMSTALLFGILPALW
jgi:predicted permease